MKYQAILFDLDGTLMPMSNQTFIDMYIPSLANYLAEYVEPKTLIKAMWDALEIMLQDQSDRINESIFFEEFGKRIGDQTLRKLEPMFEEYYRTEFSILKKGMDDNENMSEAISLLKEKGYRLIIATNPMFPKVAVSKRIEYSGLNEDDFEFVSNYSIHTACKPSVKYYEEVLSKNNLRANQCLMVGNDVIEDMVVKKLGMDAWLLTDYIEHPEAENVADWTGSREEFLNRLQEVL